MKYCLACMKKIPMLAVRCPYCREDNKQKDSYFMIFVYLILLGGVFLIGAYY
jgi:predicted nucleic acid-binding Zn ribbon protein